MRRWMRVALLALAALVIAMPRVNAAPDARRTAALRFARGKALYEKHAYAKALEAFRAGFELYPLRGFLVNIGQCYRALHRFDDAARAFQQFLDSPNAPRAMRHDVEEALAQVQALRPPSKLISDPPEPLPVPVARAPRKLEPLAPVAEEITPPGVQTTPIIVAAPPSHRKPRWVWALVGVSSVLVAGGVAAGTVLGLRAAAGPSAGSLGLIDTRHK